MLTLRNQLYLAYVTNASLGVKGVEQALQDVIEKEYPGKLWWEVCRVPLFERLAFEKKDPYSLAEEIVMDIEHQGGGAESTMRL